MVPLALVAVWYMDLLVAVAVWNGPSGLRRRLVFLWASSPLVLPLGETHPGLRRRLVYEFPRRRRRLE